MTEKETGNGECVRTRKTDIREWDPVTLCPTRRQNLRLRSPVHPEERRTLYIVGRSMGPDAAGYTSSYTSCDPTHPLDPRKIFSPSFWSSILSTEQTVRYSFDVRGFNLDDYGVLVSRSPFSQFLLLPFSLPSLYPSPEPVFSIFIRWFIISSVCRERYSRSRGFVRLSWRVPRNRLFLFLYPLVFLVEQINMI